MFALWVFRLHEGYVEMSYMLGMWLFFPAAALVMALLFRKRDVAETFFFLSLIYCSVYALCCLTSDDGNNLPLLFVPLFLFVFTVLFIPGIMLYSVIKARVCTPPEKNPDTAAESE
jgi:hypothetical protein